MGSNEQDQTKRCVTCKFQNARIAFIYRNTGSWFQLRYRNAGVDRQQFYYRLYDGGKPAIICVTSREIATDWTATYTQ